MNNALSHRLKHYITIQKRVDTSDGAGGLISGWSTHVQVWAEMIAANAAEISDASKDSSRSRYIFNIRYQTGITPQMRISYDGRLFEINSLQDMRDKEQIIRINASEVI